VTSRFTVDVPVVLAPMAGITNRAFRRLCRESGAGLYVSEMVTSRALIEGHAETLDMVSFAPDEQPRSVQLYGVDPTVVGAAVELVVRNDMADHIDLNMGCPVPKVTRKGGGSALPWKADLFKAIVTAAVTGAQRAADEVGVVAPPVTVKMRKGIDDDHLTYLRAGRDAAEAGVAWVALHGRTAAQMYGGEADWSAISRLVEELEPYGVPVLGNGDIWTAQDALRMTTETGCAGVVVGRGCLGRPWLFGELDAAFRGLPEPALPTSDQVTATMRRHAELLVEMYGDDKGCRDFRKHIAWYLKGFVVRQPIRAALGLISTLAELDDLLAQVTPGQPFPVEIAAGPRGRTTPTRRVALPDGWLDSPCLVGDELDVVAQAELSVSGG
jgi:nifR3 family TIM-barrel protein